MWQAAKRQCDLVGSLLLRPEFRTDRQLSEQMNGAALSVMLIISEGFLRYAFASNGELKAGYYAAEGRAYLGHAEMADLIALNDSMAKMLRRWQATLTTRTRDQGRNKDQGQDKDQGRTKDQERTED